jgi:DNA-binding CsgD family transcriptional regulator
LGVHRRLSADVGPSQLTGRERQVLELAGHGYSIRRIAGQLRISESTVNTIIRSASLRLGARSRLHASAMSSGRIDLPSRVVLCDRSHLEGCHRRLDALGGSSRALGHGSGEGQGGTVGVGTVQGPDELFYALVALGHGVDCIIGADAEWALMITDAVRHLGLGVVHLVDAPESDSDLMASLTLTREEQTVLAGMASGLTLAEAADAIGFSRRTAARRLAGAKRRLGAGSAAEAVERWAEYAC